MILSFYILILSISSILAFVCGVYIKLPGTSVIDNPKTPVYAFDGGETVLKYNVKYVLPDSFLLMFFPFLMLFRFKALEEDNTYWCVTNKQIKDMENLIKSPEEIYKEYEKKSLDEYDKFKLINRDYYGNFK